MRALLLAGLLVALPLAGCLQPESPVAPAARTEDAPVLLAPGGAHAWNGSVLKGRGAFLGGVGPLACWTGTHCPEPQVECGEGNCERVPFRVEVPEGHWDRNDGFLEVSIRWPTGPDQVMLVRIEDAAGRVLAWGVNDYVGATGRTALLPRPPPGDYAAVVLASYGQGGYQGVIEVESRPARAQARELLPNLVTLPPTDLNLVTPGYVGVSYFVLAQHPLVAQAAEALGVQGCRLDEAAEARAARCLRFSNAVGNVGEGPLEVRLSPAGAAAGRFVQLVHASDGSTRAVEAGKAEWHATHAHWHNAAANRFTVHPYDLATGVRGEPLHEGRKGGVCFADVGLVDLGLPGTSLPLFSGWGCLEPHQDQAWTMGLSPNWYDLYAYLLSDQYVDVSGAPDGVYQLCSVTNQDGTILESDLGDNEACTTFRLAGDAVETLDPAPYHAMQGDPMG